MRYAIQQVMGPVGTFLWACAMSLLSLSSSAVLAAGVHMPFTLTQRARRNKPDNGKCVHTVSQCRALMRLLAYVLIAVLSVASFPVAMGTVRNDDRVLIPTDFSLRRIMCGGKFAPPVCGSGRPV